MTKVKSTKPARWQEIGADVANCVYWNELVARSKSTEIIEAES